MSAKTLPWVLRGRVGTLDVGCFDDMLLSSDRLSSGAIVAVGEVGWSTFCMAVGAVGVIGVGAAVVFVSGDNTSSENWKPHHWRSLQSFELTPIFYRPIEMCFHFK